MYNILGYYRNPNLNAKNKNTCYPSFNQTLHYTLTKQASAQFNFKEFNQVHTCKLTKK